MFPAVSEDGELVEHPILEEVRHCSSTPDLAADFFAKLLNYEQHKRPTAAQALQHPYLRECAAEMQACLESHASMSQDSPAPEGEVRVKPGKRKVLARMGGAVKHQGGRLARTAGRVIQCLPLFKGRRTSASNDTAGSGRMSSSDSAGTSSFSSCGNSSSQPPLSAYFFDYKHKAEQHSLRQEHKEASTVGAQLCNEHEAESRRHQKPPESSHLTGKEGSDAISMQAWTGRQLASTDRQAEPDAPAVPKLCARQAVMPVGQVKQTGLPKQSVPVVEKEQMCSALSAVPAACRPCQPDLNQIPVECDTDEEEEPPVLSSSRYPPRCFSLFICLCTAYLESTKQQLLSIVTAASCIGYVLSKPVHSSDVT